MPPPALEPTTQTSKSWRTEFCSMSSRRKNTRLRAVSYELTAGSSSGGQYIG
jgi:hypothetical protein